MRHVVWMLASLFAVAVSSARAASPEPDCALHWPCWYNGECTALDGKCVIGSDADCLRRNDCVFSGKCAFDASDRTCRAPKTSAGCRATPACSRRGLCVRSADGFCVADDASCAASLGCKADGLCKASPTGTCVPDGKGSCARSRTCSIDGRCHDGDEECRATNASCARSRACKVSGLCSAVDRTSPEPDGACHSTATSCPASEDCKRGGQCSDYGGLCVLKDCSDTAVCKDYGACGVGRGRGLKGCYVRPEIQGEDQKSTCEVVFVTGVTLEATSTLAPWKSYRFDAAQAADNNLATSWQPAREPLPGGQALTLHLPKAQQVVAVAIFNGFQTHDALGDESEMNGLVSAALVTLTPTVHELVYAGPAGVSGFDLVRFPPTTTDTVTIGVLATSPGSVSDDPAISEIQVFACK